MMRFLREPLLHFVALGALIFGAYALVPKNETARPDQVVVTQAQISMLATTFAGTWQRGPTSDEMNGLIRDYIREEIAAREAIALGLDKDDTVIRRRLRQKLEFISEDVTRRAEPTQQQLQDYLAAHQDVFRIERMFTFTQVYFDPARRGERVARDADSALARLRSGPKIDALMFGDSLLLGSEFAGVSSSDVVKEFGEDFTAKLATLPVGTWEGPIHSGYGVHLVRIDKRDEGELPPLAKVRDAVEREWANAQRVDAKEAFYRDLLARYSITIEPPPSASSTGGDRLADAHP